MEKQKEEATTVPAQNVSAGQVPTSESELVEMTIKADNDAHDEEKENKRMRTKRIVSAVTDVLGGIGNMILANKGIKPAIPATTMTKKYQDEYKKMLEERKKRAGRHRTMRYTALSNELKAAQAAKAAKTEYERKKEFETHKNTLAKALEAKKAELQKAINKSKTDDSKELQTHIYSLRKDIEKLKIENANARADADRESRERIADANNRNKVTLRGYKGHGAWLVGEDADEYYERTKKEPEEDKKPPIKSYRRGYNEEETKLD